MKDHFQFPASQQQLRLPIARYVLNYGEGRTVFQVAQGICDGLAK